MTACILVVKQRFSSSVERHCVTTRITRLPMIAWIPRLLAYLYHRLSGKSSGNRRLSDLSTMSYIHDGHPYVQQDVTILDLFTTVPRQRCKDWDWAARSSHVPSAVAQHMPIWPIGAKPSLSPGSLIMNTPTAALWFSVGWTAMADDAFCKKTKQRKRIFKSYYGLQIAKLTRFWLSSVEIYLTVVMFPTIS